MTTIEIELKSPGSQTDIYTLRQYLQENNEGLQIQIKEQPALQGQMAVGIIEPILLCVVKEIAGRSFEAFYSDFLKPKIDKWVASRKQSEISTLEIVSTFKDDHSKVHFLENSKGQTKIIDNAHFAINTDRTCAVLIGVGTFESNFSSIPPVKGNLEDFYQLLTDKRHIGLPRENVIVLLNETHKEIMKQLHKAARAENTDTLIIYFVGHGYRADVKKLYLVATDTEKLGDDILGGIDLDFIKDKILKNSPIPQKILIIDACHSGIAAEGNDDLLSAINVKGTCTLTSSPGDEVSYFNKGSRNTYFTATLLDVLRNGTNSYHEMLSLEDLYDHARTNLLQKNFPHPSIKNELNISSSSFFIAHNPLFSIERIKQRADKLYNEGNLEEALKEYNSLLIRFPDDVDLLKKYNRCQNDLSLKQYVEKANTLFYKQGDYKTALSFYRKAYELRKDAIVSDKIKECENNIRNNEQFSKQHVNEMGINLAEVLEQKVKQEKPVYEKKTNPQKTTVKKRTSAAKFFLLLLKIIILIIILRLILGLLFH